MTHHAHFRVERRIPLMLFITLGMQIAATLMWATYLEARVTSLETHAIEPITNSERFARLEERIAFIQEDVALIRRKLER